jgi:glutamine synthetase
MAPLFDEFYAAARGLGLPVRTLMSEYSPGQFEITLEHRDDALRAVDDAILFKRVMRGVAARNGLVASFMAKPFAERAGSGMHLHARIVDDAGRNLFAAAAPESTALLRQAIGGLRETMADGMAVFAPHANSYRRFRAQSYAPVAPTWGINNRTVSLRVPAGPPASRHVEHRVAGADANPYLVAALVLAGMLRGMDAQSDPGPPVTGNGYAQNVAPPGRCTGRRRSSARRMRSLSPKRSDAASSMCSSRSSATSARSSARSSRTATTSGTSTRYDRRADIIRYRRAVGAPGD